MIDWEKSAEFNGCSVEWLKTRFEKYPKSGKKVWAICNKCSRGRWLPYASYRDVCKQCSDKSDDRKKKISDARKGKNYGLVGENSSRWNGGKIIIKCDYCGKEIKRKPSGIKKHNFCKKECHNKWMEENLIGENHPLYKQIIIKCDYCGKEIKRVISGIDKYNFCCRKCYNKWRSIKYAGENCPSYGIIRSEKFCEMMSIIKKKYYEDNPEILIEMSERTTKYFEDHPEVREKISRKSIEQWSDQKTREKLIEAQRLGWTEEAREKLSAIRQGIPYEKWPGFIDKSRPHLTPIHACIQLNQRFPGSEGHHIMSSVVIFLPRILHRSIWHNFKTGVGMDEINKLAFNFLLCAQY